jgi:DNA polymerase-3 subunit gamma/tau
MATDKTMKAVQPWATKYRPRKFGEVVGQDDVVMRLRGIIKSRALPNAILFAGPSGCGKTTLARIFARYVNCDEGTLCGKCPSCLEPFDNHPDILETNAADARGIDDIRNLIRQAQFKPRNHIRVFIIDETHQLTPQAQQAFLKPLEQPPSHTLYIFCTTDPQKFTDAMLNRCQRMEILLPSKEALIERLKKIAEKESLKIENSVYAAAAEYSGGHVRSAINILEGAAQMLRADPKIETKKLVKKLAANTEPESAMVAVKILLGLYLGKKKPVVAAIFDCSNAIELLNLCLRMNQYLIGTEYAPESRNIWHTADLKRFKVLVKDKCPDVSVSHFLEVHKRLVDLRAELQNFAVAEIPLLLARLT